MENGEDSTWRGRRPYLVCSKHQLAPLLTILSSGDRASSVHVWRPRPIGRLVLQTAGGGPMLAAR